MRYRKSHKLDGVLYDIRGPVSREAARLEEEGYRIVKLHTGNPAPFGLGTPDEIVHDIIVNFPYSQGYLDDAKGLFPARKAVMQSCQERGIDGVEINDVYIGNGVSELILMALQALLNRGDEILIPSPDYPLWTAAAKLGGGKPVHYLCDEQSDWQPDLEDIGSKISDRTRGIVIISPNNPTGVVYEREIVEKLVDLARKHDLIVFSDEIYDKILYDDAQHVSPASLAPDVLCLTFNGLSKAYRCAGFRVGWMVVSGPKHDAKDYVEGLDMLAGTRLCSNVPAQFGVQTALGGYQSINDLVKPGGRLYEQREASWSLVSQIPGITCVRPRGALYLFPRIDPGKIPISDDRKMVLDLLIQEHVLVVQGTGFNWSVPDHFRIVFLPRVDELREACGKLHRFFSTYRQ